MVWFVAGDLAKALDYSETGMMLRLCDDPANMAELNKINGLSPATKWINESDCPSKWSIEPHNPT